MGIFISNLKAEVHEKQKIPKNKSLVNNSLSKLREYHGSFKSICDTFAIDSTEYEQIFSNQEKSDESFKIWDTDKNGLIDALELFAGLIIFSEDTFEDKVRFLFDIFDFNELNSLAIIDLEFMLISCANATFKLYQIDSEIDEQDVSDFLKQDFSDDARINISQMLKWLSKSNEICEFMQIIGKQLPEQKKNMQKDGKKTENWIKPVNDIRPLPSIINSKKYQQKLDWLSLVSKKLYFLSQNNNSQSAKDVSCKVNWVYGFRSNDVRKPLAYLKHGDSEKYLYFSANIIIIYYPQVNEQRHYLEHDREVFTLAVSKNQNLIASGELGDKPAIHIWNSKTLQNLGVIKGIHQKGITMICFFQEDELIASIGMREMSPILIYNVKNYSLVLSTLVNKPVISLLTIENFVGEFKQYNQQMNEESSKQKQEQDNQMLTQYQNNFIVSTNRQILLFHYNTSSSFQHFDQIQINLDELPDMKADLTCSSALRINAGNPYLKAYIDDQYSQLIIVTGHSDGSVYYWTNFDVKTKTLIEKYTNEDAVVNITTFTYGIIISTEASKIHLWDFSFKNNIKNIDLTTFSFKLFNYSIADVLVVTDKLLVTTKNGDIIEIKFQQRHKWEQNQFMHKMNATRVNFITKLQGNLKAMCLLERPENDDKILFVAGSSTIVYGFSLETHEIVDIWTIGEQQQITCMDCVNFEDGGTVFVIGSEGGILYMRIDWEESPRTYNCQKTIHDVKFSSDCFYLIAAVDDSHVYVFIQNNNSYFQMQPKKIQFEGEIPISIDMVDDNKSFLVGTNIRNQYKVELPDLKSKNLLQENEKINCTIWNIRYPLHTKNYANSLLPVIIGGDIKVILCAGESGFLYFWRDLQQLESNCGGFLKGHSSQISRLLMTKSQDIFFSLGLFDNTTIEWKVDFINDFNDFSKPFFSTKNFQPLTIEKSIPLKDDILIRELAYSYVGKNNYISDTFKDQFVLFRGTNQKMINQHLYNHLSEQGFEESNFMMKRPPALSIELDFVYGFQSFDKRHTLHYAHIYSQESQIKKKKSKKKVDFQEEINSKLSKYRNILDFQKKKDIFLSSQVNFSQQYYQEVHENCKRYFVYFTSRIAIVYNPLTNKQRFYEGHRSKITCLAMHPLFFYVASGEANFKPSIHVWNVVNCEPFKIIPTTHKNGIIHLAFSKDSSLIVSIGMDINFSIQVTNWKTEEIVGIRNSGQFHIFDAQFNPLNRYEFTTCGTQTMTVWNISGRNLIRKYNINVAEDESNIRGPNVCVTCVGYVSYYLESKIQCDIIAGNNFGDIALITNGKYIIAYENAHNNKMINCIKVFEAFQKKILIITAGEDEMIYIWDTKFNKINQIQLNTLSFFDDYKLIKSKNKSDQKNISAQSIDVFICAQDDEKAGEKGKKKEIKQHLPKILIGTRNGDIFEATFSLDQVDKKKIFDKEKVAQDSSEEEETQKSLYGQNSKGFKFDSQLYLRSHSSQVFYTQNKATIYDNMFNKKVYFALHPSETCMVSVGEDQFMYVFDTASNRLLRSENLGQTPTAIKFSPEGDLLIIGFANGDLQYFDSKIKKNTHGKLSEKYEQPTLKLLDGEIRDKSSPGTAVLNIEFSAKGEMLAVSYDNARQKEFEGKMEKEGSYITIYSNRASFKANKPKGSDKNLYTKYLDIRSPSTYESYRTESNAYGCAVYFMTFSSDEKKSFLLIYYQLVDNYLVRVNHDSQGFYLIWDLYNKQAVKSWDEIKDISWKCFNFPNSLLSQYQYYSNLIIDEESKTNQQPNQNISPPYISCMFDLRPYLINGSIRGDLHFVKNSSLWFEQDFVTENIPKDKMCLAKSYSAHVSFVNQIETTAMNQDYLFTSGITDETIMKWKFIQEEQYCDLDNMNYPLDQPDLYSELITKDKFTNQLNEVLPLRNEVAEVNKNIEDTKESSVNLVLENIIGRKAYNKLNNLFYDYDENIVYLAGCNLVITNPREEELQDGEDYHLKQEFVKLDQSPDSINPEISCFSLSKDKKFLVAGTIQINARIFIWDICSRTCIKTMAMTNSSIILLVKFAYNNRHICSVALTNEYTMIVYLIDSHLSQVLGCANFPYSAPFKIKDIEFFPDSIFRFVTCGVQHMAIWSFKGQILSYQNLEIENPKDEELKKPQKDEIENKDDIDLKEEEIKEEEDEEDQNKTWLRVAFLAIVFQHDLMITAGDEGNLYIWQKRRITQKVLAHSKSPILCLHSQQNSNIFASGGIDGRVNLWQILPQEYNFSISKIQDYFITKQDTQEAVKNPQNFVQSVCIGSRYILAGTKSGDVYELIKVDPDEQLVKDKKKDNKEKENVILRLSAQDNEIPCTIAFSKNSNLIYTITQKGLFSVWDLKTLQRRYYKAYDKETHSLIVCKETPKIIVAFFSEIIVINSDDYSYDDKNKLPLDNCSISDMKLSHCEKMLAIALQPQKEQPKIEIYDAANEENKFKLLCQVGSLSTSIEYLDFTMDSIYLLYKDNFEEVSILDLQNLKKTNTLFVEHDAEWCSDGIKVSEKTKGVHTYYSDANKILRIATIGDKNIVVTDEMGTIRIFTYPCESGAGNGYMLCYTDHLNYINQCCVSPNQQYLITCSEVDRCVFIWKIIKQNEINNKQDLDQ